MTRLFNVQLAPPAPEAAPPAPVDRNLLLLLAVASGVSVANVYYAQPLLDALSRDFAISRAAVGGVITATQVGCALALFLLVPLGDVVSRRRLMLVQALALASSLVLVSLAHGAAWLLVGMLGTGLFGTAMTQGLIAYAASAARPSEAGKVVGTTQAGVFIGLLLARVVSGGISDIAGWRGVYVIAATAMLMLAGALWRALPELPVNRKRVSYFRLVSSMATLIRQERTLRVRGTIALLMFAAFNIFWSALVLPLSAAPYQFSHTGIGAFGLVGALGALAATRAGRWVDEGRGERTTAYALGLLLFSWLPMAFMHQSLWWLSLGIVLLDLGGQAIHVTNQGLIFRTRPSAQGQLVAAYMLFYAVGSGLGAAATTMVYARYGWVGVCVLGASVSLAALVFWAVSLRRICADTPSTLHPLSAGEQTLSTRP